MQWGGGVMVLMRTKGSEREGGEGERCDGRRRRRSRLCVGAVRRGKG